MSHSTNHTLQLPGANLYYEVRGAGPVLLLIPGGNGDAAPFERAANELAAWYTVVTYDRRGFSRSTLDASPDDQRRLETDCNDAIRLLDELSAPTAFVLGSSSGAIVALDLITRHPERIRRLVAHEPPLFTLLPDADKLLKTIDDLYDTYRRAGVEQAMKEFSAWIGLKAPPRPPPGTALPKELLEMMSRVHANFVFWFEHEVRQYPRVVPDIAALEAAAHRLFLVGGRESHGLVPYRPNLVLAERLGLEVIDFPGDHLGYATYPVEFAAQLHGMLSEPDRPDPTTR